MAGTTGSRAGVELGRRQRRWIGATLLVGGVALAVSALFAWFSAVTVPGVQDAHSAQSGGVYSCQATFDVILPEVDVRCREPLAARRTVAVALTLLAGLFLVVGSTVFRTTAAPAVRRRLPAVLAIGASVVAMVALMAVVGVARRDAAGTRTVPVPAHGLTVGGGLELLDEPVEGRPPVVRDEPLSVSDDAEGALSGLVGAELRDGAAILRGDHGSAVVDAATGEVRWSLREFSDDELVGGDGARLFGDTFEVVDLGDEWGVVVEYSCPDRCAGDDSVQGNGVAALAVGDGRVLWRTPIVTDTPANTSTEITRVRAGGGAVVVQTYERDEDEEDDAGALGSGWSTVALDPSDGRRRWEADDLSLVAVVGDTVLAREMTWSDEQGLVESPSVLALDAATGEVREDLLAGVEASTLLTSVGDVAVLQITPEQDDGGDGGLVDTAVDEIVALDLRSGRRLATIATEGTPEAPGSPRGDLAIPAAVGIPRRNTCTHNGSSLVACAVVDAAGHDLMVTFDLDGGDVSLAPLADRDLYAAQDFNMVVDRVLPGAGSGEILVYGWLPGSDEDNDPEGALRYVGLDRRGYVVDPGPAFVPLATSGDFMLGIPNPDRADHDDLVVPGDVPALAVYRIDP